MVALDRLVGLHRRVERLVLICALFAHNDAAAFLHASQQKLSRVLTCSCCGRSDRTGSLRHRSCLLKPPAPERGLVIQADRHSHHQNPLFGERCCERCLLVCFQQIQGSA